MYTIKYTTYCIHTLLLKFNMRAVFQKYSSTIFNYKTLHSKLIKT